MLPKRMTPLAMSSLSTGLVVPIPTSPALSTNNRPVPLVATASWSAPGENTPVSGSPSIASDGAAAVPDAIMPEVKVAVAPLKVTKLPLVKLD